MKNFTKIFFALLFAFTQAFTMQSQTIDLSLQGVLELDLLSGGSTGKAIHVKAINNISDLSVYGIGIANNGGGTDDREYTFPAISVLAGEDVLVYRDSANLSSYFGVCWSEFDHVIVGNYDISQSGDDAVELFLQTGTSDSVVETFGDINVDGTGEAWEYTNSYAYKINPGTTGLFVIADWFFAPLNCEIDATSAYSSTCPLYPICPPQVAYTVTMTDSWCDGWDGASWTATSTSTGTVFGPYTVSSGCSNTETFTTTDPCFTFVVGGGNYAGEHSWTLDSAGVQIDAGGDPYNGSFGACTYGCTDAAYDNYDASADFDDGSCMDTYTLILTDSWCDGWDGASWTATSTSTGTVFGPYTVSSGCSSTEIFSSADNCFSLVVGGGNYAGEHSWVLNDAAGNLVLAGGDPYSGGFGNAVCYGCTDPNSADYDASVLFDDGSCTYPCLDADTSESFETNLGMWEQDATDDMDWIRDSGGTPSFSTGPTTGFDGSYYMFIESGYPNVGGDIANLVIPCIDPTAWTTASMVFAYHMYGAATGTLNVDASDDNGATWTNLWTLSGDQGNIWSEAVIDLSSYTTQIDLRIQAVNGNYYAGDMAIDLTRLRELPILGCTDTNANNYDVSAEIDNGSCTYTSGCTNVYADNFDANAFLDDGSCTYTNCTAMTLDMVDSYGDGWNGNSFVITDDNGYEYLNATILLGSTGTATVCLPDAVCFNLTCGGGSYPGEVSWSLTADASSLTVVSGGAPYSDTLCTPLPSACIDPLASNYDANALLDDGSCLYATTFNVDMNCEPAGSFGYVHLESPLFNWCGGCVPMTDPDGDGIHSVTVDLALGNFEYKYAVDSWGGQENLIDDMLNGGTCAPVTDYFSYANRLVDVVSGTVNDDTYGSCDACVLGCTDPVANNYDATATTDDGSCMFTATFNVDMTCEDPTTYTTVSLESAYFGCFTGCTQMSDPDGDLNFSVTVDIPGGDFVYFYSIDNNSSREDLVDDMVSGETCAPITDYFSYANRMVTATSGISTSDTYGSCIACIAGCTDPTANNYDSTMTTDDGSCEWDVTFSVDMNCAGFTPTTLAATGPADGWSGNTYLLADADGDGVWTATYSVTDNFIYMYAADAWANSEFNGLLNEMLNGNGSCVPETDGLSYAYRVASAPSTTSDVYASCDVCLGGCTDPAASNYDPNTGLDDGSCVYATVFNVDMNCETAGSFGYVHLESPVFGWCGGCVPLTDPDGDGVHSVTVDLPLGNFEYKYAVDSWAGQEDLVDDMQNGASCAPVTDYFSYANRLVDVSAGTVLDDTYGSCDICDQVNGCTDAGAVNFDALATDDDGSCLFSTTFNVDMNCEPTGSFGYVHLESPSFGWCGGCVPMTDSDGDGVHSVTVDLPAGNFEYKYAVDGFAGQEDLIDDMVAGASCAPVTDYFSYANRLMAVNEEIAGSDYVQNGNFSDGSLYWNIVGSGWAVINEKMDLYVNAGSIANTSQDVFTIGLTYRVTLDAQVNSGSTWIQAGTGSNSYRLQTIDSSGTYSFIFTADRSALVFISEFTTFNDLTIDNISAIEITYNSNPSLDDTYGSCSDCIQGCTDSLAFNYNDSAMVDDGSCLYGNLCPSPSPLGLSSSDIYAEMATVHWADANAGDCRVEKYFVRYRALGDTVWTTKSAGAGSGLCNVGLPNTSKTLRGLMASTTYEYKMKAFYCGGGESGYSYADQFTTLSECAPMNNLAVQTFTSNQSKAKFTWGSTGTYVFARIALRVDNPGSTWQTAGGFGVFYPTYSVNKFGLQSGTEYRAQGRTFCDANVTSYRSTWTSPITWTQPGVAPIRLEGGSAINNFDVYPNPSKDIFNISFVSEKVQNLEVKVLNMLGEVIYTEGLEQFVGEYTKQINLSGLTKGVYFLEIMTNNGVVNKKIVLQ